MQYSQMKKILESFDNPVDKLEAVMDFGNHLENVPAGAKCTEIVGCASHVEICVSGNNKLFARADSGLVRGIVAILLAMVDGKSPAEIKNMDLYKEFSSLNLTLGAGRLTGLNSMISFLQNL